MTNDKPLVRSPGKILVHSGHMTDTPDRPVPRFPQHKAPAGRAAIASLLDEWQFGSGDLAIGGGARGADTLIAELCLERGVRVIQLIALAEAEFLERSVRVPGTDWEARYRALAGRCERRSQPETLGQPAAGENVFARNNLWSLAIAQAEAGPRPLYALLVWDEKPTGDGPGGTSYFAAEVKRLGGHIGIVNPVPL